MMRRVLFVALLATSCSLRKDEAKSAAVNEKIETVDQAAAKVPAGQPGPEKPADTRKIVHTGTLRLTVESYESARQEIEALVTAAGGFVASANVQHGDRRVNAAELTLRIPAGRFPELVHRISQLGRIVEEATRAEDVTEAWVDVEARLKNARQMEGRLLEIVAKGPDRVADLLEVERELGRVRGEIEGYEGRMRVMKDQVELGTLTLGLYTDEKYVPPTVGARATSTLERSWNVMVSFGEGILFVFLALVPWLPPIALVVWLAVRWRRRGRITSGTLPGRSPPAPAP
jgi:hypothetical protein